MNEQTDAKVTITYKHCHPWVTRGFSNGSVRMNHGGPVKIQIQIQRSGVEPEVCISDISFRWCNAGPQNKLSEVRGYISDVHTTLVEEGSGAPRTDIDCSPLSHFIY